jgi:hypothetical protein
MNIVSDGARPRILGEIATTTGLAPCFSLSLGKRNRMTQFASGLFRCPCCESVKPSADFPPRKDRASGRMSRCHSCDRQRSAAYYLQNRRQVLDRQARNRRQRVGVSA